MTEAMLKEDGSPLPEGADPEKIKEDLLKHLSHENCAGKRAKQIVVNKKEEEEQGALKSLQMFGPCRG